MEIKSIILSFFIYSFIGWISEVIYCSILQRKLVNRGFLKGPICPIYGFAAVLLVYPLQEIRNNYLLVFVLSMVLASTVEYISSYILEKLFSMRWWDYTNYRLNINGRICLRNSLMFGIMGLGGVSFVQPFLSGLIGRIPEKVLGYVTYSLLVVFVADIIYSVSLLVHLREKISRLYEIIEELKRTGVKASIYESRKILREKIIKSTHPYSDKLIEKLNSIGEWKREHVRVLTAFPGIKKKIQDKILYLQTVGMNAQKSAEEKFSKSITKPVIQDKIEKTENVFAKGLCFYKLFWVFVVSSIIGVFIESAWCLFRHGYIENRSALIYIPFNMVYGIGAVLMTWVLYRWRDKKDSFIIVVCMIIGGVLEFSLSLFQEKVFNSVSWDYSSFQVNFGGRTNLLYSFFWGFLGLCWIKFLYPSLSEQIEKVRPLTGKILTAVVSVILVISMGISSFALLRQENRLKGVPPKNELEVLADKYYNDEYLKKVYPNMILKVQEGKDSSLQTGGSKE